MASARVISVRPFPLPPAAPAPGTRFSPIAKVFAGDDAYPFPPGSGFVVHPQVVLTAAHVVAPQGVHGARPPARISVDLSLRRAAPVRVAIPEAWLDEGDWASDLAVLWLEARVCLADEALAASPLDDGTRLPLQVWGVPREERRRFEVDATRQGPVVVGLPPADSVGFSGGPWFDRGKRRAVAVQSRTGRWETGVSLPMEAVNAMVELLWAG